jgi:hypothetical protein
VCFLRHLFKIYERKKMSNLSVKVSQRTKAGKTFFEGTVSIPGVRPTKLAKRDQTTQFSNRSGVLTAARNFAKKFGFSGVDTGEGSQTQRAAKKTVRTTKAKAKRRTTEATARGKSKTKAKATTTTRTTRSKAKSKTTARSKSKTTARSKSKSTRSRSKKR